MQDIPKTARGPVGASVHVAPSTWPSRHPRRLPHAYPPHRRPGPDRRVPGRRDPRPGPDPDPQLDGAAVLDAARSGSDRARSPARWWPRPCALPSAPLPFVAITPCRVADTRGNGFTGQYGPPSIPNSTRDFTITGQCGIPSGAIAVSFNFTILDMTTGGDIRAYPAGGTMPLVSTQNWIATTGVIANAAIVPIGTGGAITIKVDGTGVIDLIIDVNGYYASQSVVSSLNTLTGDLTLAPGSNIAITPSANTLTDRDDRRSPEARCPAGTTGQTLYSNGSGWLASSALTNDGTNVGISGNLVDARDDGRRWRRRAVARGPPVPAQLRAPASAGNTFLGQQAGNFTLTGTANTAIGRLPRANTFGENNTATGVASLSANATGIEHRDRVQEPPPTRRGTTTARRRREPVRQHDGRRERRGRRRSPEATTTGNRNTAVGSSSLPPTPSGSSTRDVRQPHCRTRRAAATRRSADALYTNTTGSRQHRERLSEPVQQHRGGSTAAAELELSPTRRHTTTPRTAT